ncbi:hypothetical protein DAPPUDRAFT_326693 [Daphnia pulex]|uniref:Uncharacterized protein n=1 Tax=Daphnia pulex TaxID=6669 RepID=E9H8I9_DAPPU|nr:hypothetical protein DAPPUDRAFT_326693 [Daphnia pulex]|eukprot:EFX71954.1 hypothetical protein DAPPUDRAFT_326693 [Daphnia pulex]
MWRIGWKKRLSVLLKSEVVLAALYLDPRYNVMLEEDQLKSAQKNLIKLWRLIEFNKNDPPANTTLLLQPMQTNKNEVGLTNDELQEIMFKKEAELREKTNSKANEATIEKMIQDFVKYKLIARSTDVLKYWEDNRLLQHQLSLRTKEQLQLAESNEEESMDTRETDVPITKETPNEEEACPVSAMEDEIPLITDETLREESNVPTDPLIHNEVTQETKMIIDQDAHDTTPIAAEVPQVGNIDQPRQSTRIRARHIQSAAKQAVLSNDSANQDSTVNPTEPGTYCEEIKWDGG